MVIYKHEFNFKNEVTTNQIEVEEKTKIYVILKGDAWRSRISKNDIGKILGNFGVSMYTLTPDNTPFIKALIERTERDIESFKNRLEIAVARKTKLLKLLEKQ